MSASRASLVAREQMLKHRIRAMPIAEKLRLAADFEESGKREWAINILRLALSELEGT